MKTNRIYNVFDKNRTYYVQGIYGLKTEIKPKDFVFHQRENAYQTKAPPINIVGCCSKCT